MVLQNSKEIKAIHKSRLIKKTDRCENYRQKFFAQKYHQQQQQQQTNQRIAGDLQQTTPTEDPKPTTVIVPFPSRPFSGSPPRMRYFGRRLPPPFPYASPLRSPPIFQPTPFFPPPPPQFHRKLQWCKVNGTLWKRPISSQEGKGTARVGNWWEGAKGGGGGRKEKKGK